ncbi:unnamed protein product [Bursaphelenchus xylophilus]|uniref:(pine wood nematode) hypothetical protein n=1 Tax=Bursaphelenchus xylophilus TaxID=6326 RepID=A0A1I7S117_BURXY|nr:unnamed protein product [Bursaphelenchus xylophilus]CAG9088019.1 unnamed protein product [Bursaphelenchus xylophilus]
MELLLKGKETVSRKEKNIRIQVKLEKPTGRHHTTINFAELLAQLEPHSDDEESSDDDSIGSGEAPDPSQMLDLEDLMAKGAGYDMDDEFIDDSAAVKKAVQHQKTPIYSGFFVHKGPIPLKDAPPPVVESPKKKSKATKPSSPKQKLRFKFTNFTLPEDSETTNKANGNDKNMAIPSTSTQKPAIKKTPKKPVLGAKDNIPTQNMSPRTTQTAPGTPQESNNDPNTPVNIRRQKSSKEKELKHKSKTAPSTPQQTSGASTPNREPRRLGMPPTLKPNPISFSQVSESSESGPDQDPPVRRMVGLPPIARKRK